MVQAHYCLEPNNAMLKNTYIDIYIDRYLYIYSWSQKFTYTLQKLKSFNYFTNITGIIQNAYYCLFSTDLKNIFMKTFEQNFDQTSVFFLVLLFRSYSFPEDKISYIYADFFN